LLLDVAGVRAALATIGLVSLLNAAMMVALAMRWREGTALA